MGARVLILRLDRHDIACPITFAMFLSALNGRPAFKVVAVEPVIAAYCLSQLVW